jgi:DNA (cytosine-5)-methyltransferase 1
MGANGGGALNVGSLFAGIGGFDLGFERAGMHTAWQVEQDPYCRAVLARHFPDAERFEDVRDVGAHNLAPVDLICGGFPCQDISVAGRGEGIDGARSGLWSEYARIVGELRPRYVVVENVAALLRRGLGRVLGDLAALGYDAEWDCIPASAVGAPHRRDRLWLVAYPSSEPSGHSARGSEDLVGASRAHQGERDQRQRDGDAAVDRRADVADADQCGRQGGTGDLSETNRRGEPADGSWWGTEPDVGRVADGVPHRVDRLAALGNALVPQIAEWIGRRILHYEQEQSMSGSLQEVIG